MQNSPKDLRKKILGRSGEDLTCRYLKKHGYKILFRNYTTPFGEADIVAKQKDTVCFVEVKTRNSDEYGLPSEAVTRAKQQRYRTIAKFYCSTLGEEVPIRYDVAAIYNGELTYFENAFI
ncbi:MAG: YraN family protein [Clostridiales bacterium]|nr:YraN family protein [Clostridiales bacterium]